MNILQIQSHETIRHMSEGLVYERLSIGDCHITYKNVEHPYIQIFFKSRGISAKIHEEKHIEITGYIALKGSDLDMFLIMHGVNLKENPEALDTIAEEARPHSAKCRIR